jgi:hypothetical protein
VVFKTLDQMGVFHFILFTNDEPHKNHLLPKKEKGEAVV